MTPKNSKPRTKRGRKPARAEVEGLVWADTLKEEQIHWLWRGMLPLGQVVILEGRKAVGKSAVCAAIAAAVTGGPALPDLGEWVAAPVIWHAGEDPWLSVVLPRLRIAGADLRRVAQLKLPAQAGRKATVSLPSDAELLRDLVMRSGCRLLVLDPFGSATDPEIDLRIEQQARRYAESIAQIVENSGCCALLTRNLRKGTQGDAREQGLGSVAIGNVARVILRCDEHPHIPGVNTLSVVATNAGRKVKTRTYRLGGNDPDYPRIEWVGTAEIDADQIAEGRAGAAERDEYRDAEKVLAGILANGKVPQTVVRSEALGAGVTDSTLRRAKASLRVTSERVVTGTSAHWVWVPPKGGFPEGLVEKPKRPQKG